MRKSTRTSKLYFRMISTKVSRWKCHDQTFGGYWTGGTGTYDHYAKGVQMKKTALCLTTLWLLAGCSVLQLTGDPNEPVAIDPNVAAVAETAGQALTVVGTMTGWLPLVGAGALLVAIVRKLGKKRRR